MVKPSVLRFFVTAALANQSAHWRLVEQTPRGVYHKGCHCRQHPHLYTVRVRASDHPARPAYWPRLPQALEAPLCSTVSWTLLAGPGLRGNLCSPGRKRQSEAAPLSVEATSSLTPLLPHGREFEFPRPPLPLSPANSPASLRVTLGPLASRPLL